MASASSQIDRPRGGAARPIRLMIVDDSIVARTVLSRLLESRTEFEVAGVAGNADQAMALLATMRVDIILLDVEMPGVDGLTALPGILAAAPGARVLIVSSAAREGAVATVQALTLGAADTLLKPAAGAFAGIFSGTLIERLLRIGHADTEILGGSTPARMVPNRREPIECVAIGASTGGMHALSAFFRALSSDFTPPILVTQHLPAVFMPYFAAQLQQIAGRPATVAEDGTRVTPGRIIVAPGDAHMRLIRMRDGVRVTLDRAPAVSGCLPSVDPMLTSFAGVYGSVGLAVVLSGMGRDGVIGAGAVAAAGGEIIAQDRETSVVWGMPGAIANAGLAAEILPPALLARHVDARGIRHAWK